MRGSSLLPQGTNGLTDLRMVQPRWCGERSGNANYMRFTPAFAGNGLIILATSARVKLRLLVIVPQQRFCDSVQLRDSHLAMTPV